MDPRDAARQRAIVRAANRLGQVQFAGGNLLAALTSFSHGLQVAEAMMALEKGSNAQTVRAVAFGNLAVGEVLTANGAADAAGPKLRKALDLYRELAGFSGATVGTFEQAMAQVAAKAPPDLKIEMEAGLGRFRRESP